LQHYASQHTCDYVKQWGSEKSNPERLIHDLTNLIHLLFYVDTPRIPPVEVIKKNIVDTKCLDYLRWQKENWATFDAPGCPLGSYIDILTKVCNKNHTKTRHNPHDEDELFVLWLCNRVCWGTNVNRHAWNPDFVHFWGFPGGRVRKYVNEGLVRFALDTAGDDELARILRYSWASGIKCLDPTTNKFAIEVTKRLHTKELSVKIRNKIVLCDVLHQLLMCGKLELRGQFQRGYRPGEIDETIQAICAVAGKLCHEEELEIDTYFPSCDIIKADGLVNLQCSALGRSYREGKHPLHRQLKWRNIPDEYLNRVHLILAMEGYHELLRWCLTHAQPWTAKTEIETVQAASFFCHSKIVDIFLDPKPNSEYKFLSARNDRVKAAILGAAEAGCPSDLYMYMGLRTDVSHPNEPVYDEIRTMLVDDAEDMEFGINRRQELLDQSLAIVAVCGCVANADSGSVKDAPSSASRISSGHSDILKFLVREQGFTAEELLGISELLMAYYFDKDGSYLHLFENFINLFSFLCEEFHLKYWSCRVKIERITQAFLYYIKVGYKDPSTKPCVLRVMTGWFSSLCEMGLDFQKLPLEHCRDERDFLDVLNVYKDRQLSGWEQFQVMKNDNELLEVQTNVQSGALGLNARDKGGQLLTHVAAAYDRADILQWLIIEKGMALSDEDGQGRNVLQVAEATKALSTTRWISELQAMKVITSFIYSTKQRRLGLQRREKILGQVIAIQTSFRGYTVRQTFRTLILLRLGDLQRFQYMWKRSLLMLPTISNQILGWSSIRDNYCYIKIANDSETMLETDRKLGQATSGALKETFDHTAELIPIETEADPETELTPLDHKKTGHSDNLSSVSPAKFTRIQLASYVVRWLDKCDPKYRQFFVRRMKQLNAGDRSRILAKNLKGSKSVTIFETYLEQKSGFRILWTSGDNKDILVWFVAKHKNVSRLMLLIDDSMNRSARKTTSIAVLPEFQEEGHESTAAIAIKENIILDPLGNVPLKLYNICFDEIEQISDVTWKPQLHLTEEERDIVEAKGTVVVLGRSGTGKTICICNRMDHDRHNMSHDPTFSQLFVARSPRLCNYVRDTIGDDTCTSFKTFEQLIMHLESSLPQNDKLFLPSQRMDFTRFKNEIYEGDNPGDVDALIVWTNIQAFLKGSIEAIRSPGRILAKKKYIATDIFGKKRCRLTTQQRESVYEVFLRYKKHMSTHLWDDCDRILSTIQRLEEAKTSDKEIFNAVRKSKIYVDEIQDYTQAEILLFFYICGPGDLFLAGDPAQSVVVGVEFRFEDIRAVGYHIAGPERRDLIPQKPKTVNVNFRSHSGILDTAATVLRCLFDVFPASAKELKEDRGLFHGSRPGIFYKVDSDRLSTLVSEKLHGIVIVVHDNDKSYWKRVLGGYPLVYGIRGAKGLEFKRMILLGFFKGLPNSVQKPFRDLFLGRSTTDININFPQIEGILKLLYTAITRCIEKLFIAETSSSSAGDAFVRRLTTTSIRKAPALAQDGHQEEALATRNSTDDIEKMVMTRDEWVTTGIDNAEMAEEITNTDISQAETLLDKAVYCFEQANEPVLASTARNHCSSIRFRSQLLSTDSPPATTKVELRVSWIMERLMADNLLVECRNLCISALPFFSPYTRDQVEHLILCKLP